MIHDYTPQSHANRLSQTFSSLLSTQQWASPRSTTENTTPKPKKKKSKKKVSWAPFDTYHDPTTYSEHNSRSSSKHSSGNQHRTRSNSDHQQQQHRGPYGSGAERDLPHRSFADYYSHYIYRESDARKRYRGYRRGSISTMIDPHIEAAGRAAAAPVARPLLPSPPPSPPPAVDSAAQPKKHRHKHKHRHRTEEMQSAASRPSTTSRQQPVSSSTQYGYQLPESIYYLGTPSTPPFFVARNPTGRESRYQQYLDEEEAERKRKYDSYYERKRSLPPGKGLRRVKQFFRE